MSEWTNNMRIKLCTPAPEDAEYFFDLYRRSLRVYFESTIGWDEAFRRAAFRLSYPLTHCQRLCVGDDQVCAGVLCLLPSSDGTIEVALLLIEPTFQNSGIGTNVLKQVCAQATRSDQTVRLSTFKLNVRATKLYRCLGFNDVGEDDYYLYFRKNHATQQ
jgi:ribosomal protein S18 acetylase RimI-like enzyme